MPFIIIKAKKIERQKIKMDHPFSTYAKFSEKLTFLAP